MIQKMRLGTEDPQSFFYGQAERAVIYCKHEIMKS